MPENVVGVYEIAEFAKVSPSAVINWRKRFPDFPTPIAELKSGPIYLESQIKVWLARRESSDIREAEFFYDQMAANRGDDAELRSKIEEVVEQLQQQSTSTNRPGILLGRVQSGKTRAFLGVIARAFDKGYGVAVVLTKGTKSLTEQTLSRIKMDFRDFITADQVEVFDVLHVPDLTPYELNHKIIFVVKKEDDNMRRLLALFQEQYPELREKSVLIIDDEADLASVSFRRKNGQTTVGVISGQIDELRGVVSKSSYLQVTATPYALYLQPQEDVAIPGNPFFKPKRPAFTVLLPTHGKYVGGDEYFEKSAEPETAAFFFYREVPLSERDALRKEDRRRLDISQVLTEKNTAILRESVVTFLVGGAIRRLHQRSQGEVRQKYSFLFHTEQSRSSHDWQERIAAAIRESLIDQARVDSPLFNTLLRAAYDDVRRSIEYENLPLPVFEEVKKAVVDSLLAGELVITKVNSDNDIKNLLDEDGQLKLRTPFNMFIGGQILDRGITINNLIGFYYGRNPNRFQQDTVLQHSRMYGARSKADLAVTRFFAPRHVYRVMKRIHEFDAALREAFESGANERGVYFIRKDPTNQLIACSPNKLLFSDVVSIRPGRRLVPFGFQTVSKSKGAVHLENLDSAIAALGVKEGETLEIDAERAVELLKMAYDNLDFEDESKDDREAHVAALEHLSRSTKNQAKKGKVALLIGRDRDINRYREEGRFSNAPDTKQQKELALSAAEDIPVLMLLRQNGQEERGWRGLPFWWPVVLTPKNAATTIFATEEAVIDTTPATAIFPRSLPTEELA